MARWKCFERQIAKDQGTSRTPLSGSNSRHTSSDTLHPSVYSEAKYRKVWQVCQLFEEVKIKAYQESKIPCLMLKQKGQHGYFMLFRSEDFKKLAELYREEKQASL